MNEYNERIIYRSRPSWLNYYILYLLGIIVFVFFYKSGDAKTGTFILLLLVAVAGLFRARYLFTITDDRVIARKGLIGRDTNEMKIRHIRSMHIKQSPIERILGIGSLTTISASDGEAAVIFKGIKNPHNIKESFCKINI